MWIKNYVSATFHRQGIFKYKVLIILFTPYTLLVPQGPHPAGIFASPHCGRVFTLCKTALHKLENGVYKISSIMTPLFLHSFTIKSLDLHWTYTGAALDSPSTATNTYPLSYFTHTTTPSQSVAALQRCSVARNFSKSQKTSIHL